jgi:PAS domain S-box-containing protein
MASWLEDLSIRARIALLVLAMTLPVAILLFLLLAEDLQQAREGAHGKVRILASATAANLSRELGMSRTLLARLAARPAVKALDPGHCDPLIVESVPLNTEYTALELHDLDGEVVCSSRARPFTALTPSGRVAFQAAWRQDGFHAGGAEAASTSGPPLIVLSHPVRNDAGQQIGLLRLSIDLLRLNETLLGSVPDDAILSVTDPTRSLLLRSIRAAEFIGTRPASGPDPADGQREGFIEALGRDGVSRLFAFETIPGVEWRVSAGLPSDAVFSEYHAMLARIVGLGLGGLLLAGWFGWRLSAAIVRPVFSLERTATRVAAGDATQRARVYGPPEFRAVATQFNRMLDARAISDARLAGIFESAIDAIITTDEAQTIVYANPAAADMFGCTVCEMTGAPLARFIPQRARARHQDEVRAFGAGDPSTRHMGRSRQVMALRADGTEFPIEASISHMLIDGQHFYTVIHRDVTERHRDQAALLAGKSTLEAALSSMTDAVLITDADGQTRQCNAAFARFHRFADLDTCRRVLEVTPEVVQVATPDGVPAPAARQAVARALRGEAATDVEYRLRRRDTGETWIGSYSFAPIRSRDGTLLGAVVVARDVTAYKEALSDLAVSHTALQRLIAAQDKVQEDERARIARELHDDLQQTLAAVRIDLAELTARLAGIADDELPLLKELDDLASQAIVSTRRAVDDLRPRMLEELGLVPALQALATQFSRRTGIACEVDAPPDLEPTLRNRPLLTTCLYRVAQEALNNAAKHSRATAVAVRLALLAPAQVSLGIADNGRGVTAQDRRKTDSFGLLGMNERVRAQGGRLRIERLAAGGTLLEVFVPLVDDETGSPGLVANGGSDDPETGPDSGFDSSFHDSASAAFDQAPLPRLLGRTARQALQATIDAMPGNVAILDNRGLVRFVNRGWHEFAQRNGSPGTQATGPGVSYLEVCRRSARTDPSAMPILVGLEALIAHRLTEYTCDYPCDTPEARNRFRLHASHMVNGDILVSHYLVETAPRAAEPESR